MKFSELDEFDKLNSQNIQMDSLLKKLRVILMQAGFHDEALLIDKVRGKGGFTNYTDADLNKTYIKGEEA